MIKKFGLVRFVSNMLIFGIVDCMVKEYMN